jgi:glycosyltransferase involved in cell wall biosynthesis
VLTARISDDMRVAMRRRLGVPVDAPVIGSIARLMQGKDQASLLEAFAIIRRSRANARLVIAGQSADVAPDGNGSYGEYLVRRVGELGLADSVTFTGLLPHDQMPELFATFDVFAHPCIEEPFGLVIVEAMARRRPVVAANAGGIPEIIRDGVDGVLVPRREPTALAHAITSLLDDPQRAARLVEGGGERVLSAFTPHAQAEAMTRVYRRILQRRGRAVQRPGRLEATRS